MHKKRLRQKIGKRIKAKYDAIENAKYVIFCVKSTMEVIQSPILWQMAYSNICSQGTRLGMLLSRTPEWHYRQRYGMNRSDARRISIMIKEVDQVKVAREIQKACTGDGYILR